MVIKEVEVTNEEGLLNRDAQVIVRHAMRYDSEITYERGTRKINAKSIMGVVSMGLCKGDKVMIIAVGDDCEAAAEDLANLFANGFNGGEAK